MLVERMSDSILSNLNGTTGTRKVPTVSVTVSFSKEAKMTG